MPEYTLSFKDKIHYFLQPGRTYCGHSQLRTLISVYKKHQEPKFSVFSPDSWSRLTGYMLPTGMKKIFKKYGMESSFWSFHWQKEIAIDGLKGLIKEKKKPVVLIIWHGYKDHTLQSILWRKLLMQHYVSTWWYDKQWFYIYDSSIKEKQFDLPIGNLYVPNEKLLEYRAWSFLWLQKYAYLTVN